MTELSLGISPCPNDVFIFSGLILNEVRIENITLHVEYLDIEALNKKAQNSSLDIVKISYANYVRCPDNYDLLPTGGALGRGVGPLLLSNGGQWNAKEEVLVPGEYTTANFLLDFWAQRNLHKRFLQFDKLYDYLCCTPGAQGVVIHEKRFTYTGDGLTLIQDLGSAWEEKTKSPIPLGAVLARRGLNTAAIIDGIRGSLNWAHAHREDAIALCKEHAADLTPSVIQSHINLYVNEFSYELGTEGEKAVSLFLKQQQKIAS